MNMTPHARILTLSLITASVFACQRTPDNNPTEVGALGPTLRVVSWNVRHYPEKTPARADESRAAIDAMEAEVLALQEISGGDRVDMLMETHPRFVSRAFIDHGVRLENAIVAVKGVGVESIAQAAPRMTYPASIAFIDVGALDFTIMSIHTSYGNGDSEAISEELLRLRPSIAAALERDGELLVIGDFNLEAPEMERVAKQLGLVFVPAAGGNTTSAHAYDHALMSPSLVENHYVEGSGQVLSDAFTFDVEGDPPALSDHYPIAYEFRISTSQ